MAMSFNHFLLSLLVTLISLLGWLFLFYQHQHQSDECGQSLTRFSSVYASGGCCRYCSVFDGSVESWRSVRDFHSCEF